MSVCMARLKKLELDAKNLYGAPMEKRWMFERYQKKYITTDPWHTIVLYARVIAIGIPETTAFTENWLVLRYFTFGVKVATNDGLHQDTVQYLSSAVQLWPEARWSAVLCSATSVTSNTVEHHCTDASPRPIKAPGVKPKLPLGCRSRCGRALRPLQI